jgi:Ser/Thr protein kinase RdoA (MazF antagonist)
VLRYYENRSEDYVLFEVDLLNYLRSRHHPVAAIIRDSSGRCSGMYNGKPYIIIEHIEGRHTRNPNYFSNAKQIPEVVRVVAKLHNLTQGCTSVYLKNRDTLNPDYCLRSYRKHFHTPNAREDEEWLKNELKKLQFPISLPKSVCHADLNYGNFLFRKGRVTALLDFDMSFFTYCIYDIANLIYWWAWAPEKELKRKEARRIVEEYLRWRMVNVTEKEHIYDALTLVILLGMSWSSDEDFQKGKKKVEFLGSLGREGFYPILFH